VDVPEDGAGGFRVVGHFLRALPSVRERLQNGEF